MLMSSNWLLIGNSCQISTANDIVIRYQQRRNLLFVYFPNSI